MNDYDFSCKSSKVGEDTGEGESNCKDITWADKYCQDAIANDDCKGVNKAFFQEYCPQTCNMC